MTIDERPKIVDIFTSLPTPERVALEIRTWGSDDGYRRMFSGIWRNLLLLEPDVVEHVMGLSQTDFLRKATDILERELPPVDHFLEMIRQAGITAAVVHGPLIGDVPYTNDATAAAVEAAPELLIGFCRVDPLQGETAAAEIRRTVGNLGLRGVTISPFWHGISCSDGLLRPIFATAEDLGIPVWIHCSQQWVRSRPLDLEHPRHIDKVAGEFPTVPIFCGHGGWPWVNEIVAVAWRHPNVFIDVSAFRPKHIFTSGSGWEPLVYYGQRTITDKLVYGSTWSLLGSTPKELVDEAWSSPWPNTVKHKWMHDNAAGVLGLP